MEQKKSSRRRPFQLNEIVNNEKNKGKNLKQPLEVEERMKITGQRLGKLWGREKTLDHFFIKEQNKTSCININILK